MKCSKCLKPIDTLAEAGPFEEKCHAAGLCEPSFRDAYGSPDFDVPDKRASRFITADGQPLDSHGGLLYQDR